MSNRLFARNLNTLPPVLRTTGRGTFLLCPGREEFWGYYYPAYTSAAGRWYAPGRFSEESRE
ncbi:MAG: hypothetical protein ACP5JJ_12230 [Anaerolineae bacterium]